MVFVDQRLRYHKVSNKIWLLALKFLIKFINSPWFFSVYLMFIYQKKIQSNFHLIRLIRWTFFVMCQPWMWFSRENAFPLSLLPRLPDVIFGEIVWNTRVALYPLKKVIFWFMGDKKPYGSWTRRIFFLSLLKLWEVE